MKTTPQTHTGEIKFKRRGKRAKALFPYLLVAPAVLYLMMITPLSRGVCNRPKFLHGKIWSMELCRFTKLCRTIC